MSDQRAGPIDPGSQSYRYYRNAVERHWDPGTIDLSTDRERVSDLSPVAFDRLRTTLALFGAGEEAVTEDLAPLSVVLDDLNDQLFVTTQLYEEAKHADFFDRYWRTVIGPEAEHRGAASEGPTDPRWFNDAYEELFERNETAMARLLEADTPENRARAYCHYHLTIEGILAQTGYYGVQTNFSGEVGDLPELPGLVEGFSRIRSDEGRHVGFGMRKLKELVGAGAVEPDFLHELTGELAMLTQEAVSGVTADGEDAAGLTGSDLAEYAAEKHAQRMEQIVDAAESIPDVETLVSLDER